MIDYDKLAKAVQAVTDEKTPALEVFAMLKEELDILQSAIKEIEPYALEEARLNPEKRFKDYGYRFQYTEGRRTFSFKNIQKWVDKKAELQSIEADAKQMYQAYERGLQVADENGEIMLPEVTYSKDSLSVRKL